MSQFATTIPFQSVAPNYKTSTSASSEGLQPGPASEGEGSGFAQTLQELSESNPNVSALLLALQQAGMLSEYPVAQQAGGSFLPPVTESGGNALPSAALQRGQFDGLQALQNDTLTAMDSLQLQKMLAESPLTSRQQAFAQLVQAGGAGEGLLGLESRGTVDFTPLSQGLGLQLQSIQAVAGQRPAITLPVQVPVGHPGWDSAMGERIQWMMSRHVQQAEIKVSPPELGPVEIKISLQNDQTSVHFIANHSATRDALEAAIPRLRELFGDINLNLANVDVNQRQAGDAGAQQGSSGGAGGTGDAADDEGFGAVQDNPSGVARLQSRGLLDTFA